MSPLDVEQGAAGGGRLDLMGENMSEAGEQKRGNFEVHRGALYGQRSARDRSGPRRHDPPDRWLDREMRGVFAGWKTGGTGAYASRGIQDAAEDVRHPHRILARRIREARAENVPYEQVREAGLKLLQYVDRLYGRSAKLDPAA